MFGKTHDPPAFFLRGFGLADSGFADLVFAVRFALDLFALRFGFVDDFTFGLWMACLLEAVRVPGFLNASSPSGVSGSMVLSCCSGAGGFFSVPD
jgi:hypothetical protein